MQSSPALVTLLGASRLSKDWNDDFQHIYDSPSFNPHELKQVNARKDELLREFETFTREIAVQLVAQLGKARADWIIKPLEQAKGFAGGEKFVVGKVFCKFARDDKGLYGGNDELAIKVAKNEIRNVNAVLKLGATSLHSSLMICHHVQGHSVIATALMPISDASLVYGSSDAGFTVRNLNERVSQLVDRIASHFGLLPHAIRGHPDNFKLAVAADCEGHTSLIDGRS